MEQQIQLPVTNGNGYYEMRLESIGGLGANLCGKMLGELGAACLGLNAASFSSYGSEKRGSPVKAFVRWSEIGREIRLNSPVESPHILGLFHDAMIGRLPVTAGMIKETKIVINSAEPEEKLIDLLRLPFGELYAVDALQAAMDTKSKLNMVMLGAIAKASGFIPLDAVEELTRDTLGKKYPESLDANLEGIRRGYESVKCCKVPENTKYEAVPYREIQNEWGYANAPAGGINPMYGSSVSNDVSASRQGYIPVFLKEKCINCGLCESTCPDMVFQFKRGEYKGKNAMVNCGLDYYHCKGCLRCVDVCPTGALVMGLEKEHPEKQDFMRNQDIIREKMEYEKTGANSWITSESYLDERRVEGGMV